MGVALLDEISIDAVSTAIESSFEDAKRAFETPRNTVWQSIATPIDGTGVDEVLHDFFENIEPMRKWTGGKKFQDLIERQYKTSHEWYEASVKMRRDDLRRRIRQQGFGAAAMGITNKLASRAAELDDAQVLDQLINPTLLGYDGKALFAADHPDGGGQSNQDSGGAGEYWYLMALDYPVRPVLRILGEDFMVRDHASEDTTENFMHRMLYWSVEFRGGYYPGLWQTVYRSNQTLDSANFNAALAAMGGFKDYHGELLNIRPTAVLVGRSNWLAARQLLESTTVTTGGENVNRGIVDVLYSGRLP